MSEIRGQFVCIGYPSGAGVIDLAPLALTSTSADLTATAVKVFVPDLADLSQSTFWGSAGVCARFDIIIRRSGQ